MNPTSHGLQEYAHLLKKAARAVRLAVEHVSEADRAFAGQGARRSFAATGQDLASELYATAEAVEAEYAAQCPPATARIWGAPTLELLRDAYPEWRWCEAPESTGGEPSFDGARIGSNPVCVEHRLTGGTCDDDVEYGPVVTNGRSVPNLCDWDGR